MEPVQLAAILAGAVLVASMVSVEAGISVALVELALGVALGNAFNLDPNASWLAFIASFASVVLTFLAGAEVDPDDFRDRFGASIAIGVVSFAGPFVVATLIALGPLGWSTKASLIAGTALSTTSLAVVYAVLVETGLNTVRVGKLIMSACFVTDLCTVVALSLIFIKPTVWFPIFLVVSLALIVALPRVSPWFFARYGDRVIEPEIKLVFVILLALMVLGDKAHGPLGSETTAGVVFARCGRWCRRAAKAQLRSSGPRRMCRDICLHCPDTSQAQAGVSNPRDGSTPPRSSLLAPSA